MLRNLAELVVGQTDITFKLITYVW